MLIGYTQNLSDKELAELADWADYHAKDVPNQRWKRAYALIREGADLLLRRRAGIQNDPPVEKGGVCVESLIEKKDSRSPWNTRIPKIECQACYDESGSRACIRPAHGLGTNSRGPGV